MSGKGIRHQVLVLMRASFESPMLPSATDLRRTVHSGAVMTFLMIMHQVYGILLRALNATVRREGAGTAVLVER